MPLLENELTSTDQIFLSSYGNQFALGFKGSKEFINKCHNLVHNYSIANNKLIQLEENFFYVMVKSKQELIDGLTNYFINEIKLNQEVPLLKDGFNEDESEYIIEYDETKILLLAQDKTTNFLVNKIINNNFMLSLPESSQSAFFNVFEQKKAWHLGYCGSVCDELPERVEE